VPGFRVAICSGWSGSVLVIAHRGASGYRPEHTLTGYRLAAELGADYLEPDLVATLDGVLVARHENEISSTTDVAARPEFADRRLTKIVDGGLVTGWFVEDFSYAELRTLRARERMPGLRPANTAYDGHDHIPTFDEIVAVARQESARLDRRIGVYPELKHPTHFRRLGLPVEELLAERLDELGLNSADGQVLVQSFEPACLRRMSVMTGVPLIQLIDATGGPFDFAANGDRRTYADLITPGGLREISTYAQGIGAHKDLVLPRTDRGTLGEPTGLVRRVHNAGMALHVWTFRAEPTYLPAGMGAAAELDRFLAAGVDGLFADHPDLAVAAVDRHRAAVRV
jgi:glycerophosphoryl diester phosphodiesterase